MIFSTAIRNSTLFFVQSYSHLAYLDYCGMITVTVRLGVEYCPLHELRGHVPSIHQCALEWYEPRIEVSIIEWETTRANKASVSRVIGELYSPPSGSSNPVRYVLAGTSPGPASFLLESINLQTAGRSSHCKGRLLRGRSRKEGRTGRIHKGLRAGTPL